MRIAFADSMIKCHLFIRELANPVRIVYELNLKQKYLKMPLNWKNCAFEQLPENYVDYYNRHNASMPEPIFSALTNNYQSGFRLEPTFIKMLATIAGLEINSHTCEIIKEHMFYRSDGIYFLTNSIVNCDIYKLICTDIISSISKFKCFEIETLYNKFHDKINSNCIRNLKDFNDFIQYEFKFFTYNLYPGTSIKIAKTSSLSIKSTFNVLSLNIVNFIKNKFDGYCNYNDLHEEFALFSSRLLEKIIKDYASDTIIVLKINDNICYQTFETLGLPENFSHIVNNIMNDFSQINLVPSQEALHTALSLNLKVNFMEEYNLPDWETFRRLIKLYYNASIPRNWTGKVFCEA